MTIQFFTSRISNPWTLAIYAPSKKSAGLNKLHEKYDRSGCRDNTQQVEQDGPLLLINGVATPINGLIDV